MVYKLEPIGERKSTMIKTIVDPAEKTRTARQILEALPEWFGIPEAREKYVSDSAGQTFIADIEQGEAVGFLCLKGTGDVTAEIAVMGVLKEYHRRGVGRKLVKAAEKAAAEQGYSFMQVKTVQEGRYEEYDGTNRFYRRMGFGEFELFPTLWDEHNPCQIYVKRIGANADAETKNDGR